MHEPSFEALCLPLRPALLAKAMQLTHHEQDALDLVQDAMVQAFERWDQFTSATDMPDVNRASGYLHQILKNLFIDGIRKRDRRGRVLADNIGDILVETAAGVTGDVAREPGQHQDAKTSISAIIEPDAAPPEQRSIARAIHQAVEDLAADLREVAIRSFLNDEPCEEIADAMGVSVNTTKSRIRRARHRLLEALAPERAPAPRLAMTA